ncbi:MAG: cytochrome c oxidase subunit I [Gemmatimonadaceae bacterium]
MAAAVELVEIDSLTDRLEQTWNTPKTLYGALSTVDHKTIGKRYLATAFVFLLLGGAQAGAIRAQLARPNSHLLSPEAYDQLFSMHGTTMIFWYASPILSGFSNYLVPLMIGARDMAFPRLNAFSYWTFLLSGLFIYTSALTGAIPHGGWFAYVPYTNAQYSPGANMDFYALALLFLTISTTAGAINFIVTILKMRCPGMSVSRMPLFMWSTLTTSVAIVFAMPALTAALVFLEFDRRFGTHFYDPVRGGAPLLWQHLFWVFGHPWVYIVVLPATGMASMIIPTFCRRPIVGHVYVALATVSTGIFGFGVWAHHMFATGMPALSTTFFSAASMSVSIPSGIQIFAWLATIWAARRHVLATPMLFMLGFICLFVIGGVSGVMTASVPFDWQVTDTYFIVAHLHYVLVGINLFPVLAGFYFWLPKMTGRMLDERLGRWNFWVLFVGVNLTFFPMHAVGLRGMPRRVYTYPSGMGWDWLNMAESIGAAVTVIGILLFVINVLRSRKFGAVAPSNPWGAATLEWATSSPPAEYNFVVIPIVGGREPLWERHDALLGPTADTDLAPVNSVQLATWRVLDDGKETLESTLLDADPQAALHMPQNSLWPLVLALCLTGLVSACLVGAPSWTVIAALSTCAAVGGWLWPKASTLPPSRIVA